jgi:hypothetical protein
MASIVGCCGSWLLLGRLHLAAGSLASLVGVWVGLRACEIFITGFKA